MALLDQLCTKCETAGNVSYNLTIIPMNTPELLNFNRHLIILHTVDEADILHNALEIGLRNTAAASATSREFNLKYIYIISSCAWEIYWNFIYIVRSHLLYLSVYLSEE